MRRLPFVGCYWADRQIPLAATVGNVVVVSPEHLFHAGPHGPPVALALQPISHLQILLQLSPLLEDWLNPAGDRWVGHLAAVADQLEATGLRRRVRAILVSEEASLGARGTRFDAVSGVLELKQRNLPLLLDIVCAQQTALIQAVRRQWPGMLISTVEPHWTEDRTSRYYTPMPDIDVIGLDAYVVPPITRERFEAMVVPAYAHAATYGKPILMVAQAFADADGMWQGPMPTIEHLKWYADLAEATPAVAGLVWFLLEHPTAYDPAHGARAWGLLDAPDRLAAVQWYGRWAGAVPPS